DGLLERRREVLCVAVRLAPSLVDAQRPRRAPAALAVAGRVAPALLASELLATGDLLGGLSGLVLVCHRRLHSLERGGRSRKPPATAAASATNGLSFTNARVCASKSRKFALASFSRSLRSSARPLILAPVSLAQLLADSSMEAPFIMRCGRGSRAT